MERPSKTIADLTTYQDREHQEDTESRAVELLLYDHDFCQDRVQSDAIGDDLPATCARTEERGLY